MSWPVKKLSEICTNIFAGGDVPKDRLSKFKTKEFKIPIFANGEKNKGLYGFTDTPRVTEPSITVSARGTIGYSEVRYEPFFPVVRLIVLTPNPDQVNLEYLKYVIKAMDFKNSGTSIPQLTVPMIKSYRCEIPSIPEQKRIVAILDQVFADIEQARAKTEQNLKNARELFESYLLQVFSQRGEGWEKTTLGKATGGVYTGPFGSLLHKSDYIENGIPLVNPAHITPTGVEADYRKTVSHETAQRLSGYIMRKGDIVIGRRGEMGRCALITENENGFLCGTGSFFIKLSDRCDSGYLVRYLRSEVCKSRLEKLSGGAVMPNLSNADLRNLSLYLPPLSKQLEIIELIDEVSSLKESLIAIYQQKLSALDELKKSLLQKAFTGELTKDKKGTAA